MKPHDLEKKQPLNRCRSFNKFSTATGVFFLSPEKNAGANQGAVSKSALALSDDMRTAFLSPHNTICLGNKLGAPPARHFSLNYFPPFSLRLKIPIV